MARELRIEGATSIVAAIQEFHQLRSRRLRGDAVTLEETKRLGMLWDALEPRRACGNGRTRVEVRVRQRALVTARGRSQPAKITRLTLRRVELETEPDLKVGDRLLLSIPDAVTSYHFHCQVRRARSAGATVELLAASCDA